MAANSAWLRGSRQTVIYATIVALEALPMTLAIAAEPVPLQIDPDGETVVELEEAYVTTTSLPRGLQSGD